MYFKTLNVLAIGILALASSALAQQPESDSIPAYRLTRAMVPIS